MLGAESDRACLNLLEKEYKWFSFILPLFELQQTTNALWVHDGTTLETHRGSILKIVFIVVAIQGDPWDPKYFNLFGKGKSIDKTPVCISADYPLANEQFNCKCAERALSSNVAQCGPKSTMLNLGGIKRPQQADESPSRNLSRRFSMVGKRTVARVPHFATFQFFLAP